MMPDLLAARLLIAMVLGFHIVLATVGALLPFPALYYLLRVFKQAAVFGKSRSKSPTDCEVGSGPQGGIR
ncbi:MAG: hypothetical protein Q8S75_16205 [Nitrospirota bacterium]|nr:hypothetical protein [Nitrospirota bacterium]